jgi:aldehyde dehydrogenase
MNQALMQDVVAEVMRRLKSGAAEASPVSQKPPETASPSSAIEGVGRFGIFSSVDAAAVAATEAQKKLMALSMDDRDAIVKMIKSMAFENRLAWAKMEFEETKVGRLDHKIEKLKILELVPGVEALKTNAFSGSNGVCLEEFAPYGVIGVITPVTHSIPTLSANAINMIASGNSLVINPHPSGTKCAVHAVREYNKAINAKFGIEHLITIIANPSLESADGIFNHRAISLLVVTGGPQVARAAMAAKKRAIVAGPGNPPVVVDETACLPNAAKSIVAGASFDNNLLCIGEKQVFCVESVFDKLMSEMQKAGSYILNSSQIDALTKLALPVDPKDGKPHVHKDFVGKDAAVLAKAIGITVPPDTQLLIGQTSADHPFVQVEQMMPFIPFVKVPNVETAMDLAIESEHGYRHTAIIHSQNMQTVTKFGRRAAVTLFVVNGASPTGLGLGGEGYLSYSIATPTGEGITSPLTFTRYRRVMIAGALRMI